MMESLLTTKDAAKKLGVRVKLLENHRSEMRGLPYVFIGKAVRYRRQDIRRAAAYGVRDYAEIQRRQQMIAEIRRRRRRRIRRPARAQNRMQGGR